MSHVAAVEVVIGDLNALGHAAKALGLELVIDQKSFRWVGHWYNDYDAQDAAYRFGIDPKDYGKCEHAIRIPNDHSAYEIGVMKNPKGEGYVLVYDFWGSQGRAIYDKCGGKGLEKLIQEYKLQCVELAPDVQDMTAQGFSIERQTQDNGDVLLVLDDGQGL